MIPFYERNGITIYCGDCLEVMPTLDPGFDAIIADLPYGVTSLAWDIVIPFEPLWTQNARSKYAYPKSIVMFSVGNGWDKKKNVHSTQKPVALIAYLIRTYTNSGELILDNTMGSGTTLVAAQNEGRQAVGIELSEEYCKIAVERLRQPSFFSLPSCPDDKRLQPTAKQSALFGAVDAEEIIK